MQFDCTGDGEDAWKEAFKDIKTAVADECTKPGKVAIGDKNACCIAENDKSNDDSKNQETYKTCCVSKDRRLIHSSVQEHKEETKPVSVSALQSQENPTKSGQINSQEVKPTLSSDSSKNRVVL